MPGRGAHVTADRALQYKRGKEQMEKTELIKRLNEDRK